MRPYLFLPIVALVACGRSAPEPTPAPKAPEAAAKEHGDEHGREITLPPHVAGDLRITTAQVESRPGGGGVAVLGELQVNEQAYAEVGSPVAARATRVLVSSASRVTKGQPLVELQSVELGKSRGDLMEAQARLELARRALERKRSLAAERIAPQREVQEAEAELRTAEGEAASARSSIEALGASGGSGGRYALRAPISGTVLERSIAVGQVADPGKPLFRIADLSLLWVIAHAYERDAVRVTPGSEVQVSFPALPGQTTPGRVDAVGSQVEAASRTIPVRVVVKNPTGVLRPGMAAQVRLPLTAGSAAVIAIPAAALQRLGDEWCVFLPTEPGSFEVRAVGRGRDLGGEVEILKGLVPGETVVVDGSFLLKAEAEKARGGGAEHAH